jgi:hypothetical protein
MRRQVIFDYNIDYEKARCEASKLANEVIRAHPRLKYKIVTSPGEGVFIELYGDNEDLVHQISASLMTKKLKLLLSGAPIYVIYGGKTRLAA